MYEYVCVWVEKKTREIDIQIEMLQEIVCVCLCVRVRDGTCASDELVTA